MEGSSRGAWKAALEIAHEIERRRTVDLRVLAGDLFAVSETLSGEARLRRAFADPSRDAWPKRELATQILGGQVSTEALNIVNGVVSGRWNSDQDMVDALERIGVDMVFAAVESEGRLPQLEDELFEVDQLVQRERDLGDFLGRRDVEKAPKAELLERLLAGHVSRDALWLSTRPVLNPRGRKYSAAIWRQLAIAAERRRQITAIVTSAIPLDKEQKKRIESALARTYGRAVNANMVVDPDVLGGVHIRVGDDVIDGSILRRLDDVRRAVSTT
ncbi:F0F1 ATP synthase subunit delta [Austwickia chelonae]|uniref:F0F1 ATP synthase subunit delta n=1 Tax=Austwickia chelonae TaxID=100225 RepID=UPI000E270C26|nr:F0F1 ATP synthase subunit delta [Austwickia chelonae]